MPDNKAPAVASETPKNDRALSRDIHDALHAIETVESCCSVIAAALIEQDCDNDRSCANVLADVVYPQLQVALGALGRIDKRLTAGKAS